MKNSLTAFLPLLALAALSGCASSGAIATSEDDGVYYSSKDRSTAIVTPAPEQSSASTGGNEATNPDYNGAPATSSQNSRSGQTEYYDDSYASSRNNRTYVYYGPGVAYYAPPIYAPYTTLNYGWGGGFCGFPPCGPAVVYDPFYSPFYSPFYGYGSGVTISFGYGNPWGYGGYYNSYYGSPYGYGGYGYDPYYYGGRYYGGYYGPRGYYGNSYYGGGYYGGNNYYSGGYRQRTTSGRRSDRSSSGGRVSSGGVNSGGISTTSPGGSRIRTGGRAVAETPTSQPMPSTSEGGRIRSEQTAGSPMPASYTNPETIVKPTRQYGTVDQTADQPVRTPDNQQTPQGGGKRWRNAEMNQQLGQTEPMPQPQPAAMPEGERKPRRRDYNQAPVETGYATPDGYTRPQAQDKPARQRTYDAPSSYDRPQRTEQPSFSAPSYSPPSGGGGSRGGGGGRSRGRAD